MGSGDEDCLFLNVWRPDSGIGQEEKLVAMVFIYGGGWISGGTSASILGPVPSFLNLYDGCGFVARENVIVATVNYRLGPFGFTAFEENGVASANFAMKDQRQGLRWLQKELSAFGGDPRKVTLFGESAGGMSVFYHVASPLSKGLFRAAISESGFPTAWSWEHGRNFTRNFGAHLGCSSEATLKACLKKLPAKVLVGNETATANPLDFPTARPPWQPSVDGVDMPEYPMTLFKSGQTNNVPMLAGSNTDEANLFVWPFYEKGMNQSQFSDWFHKGLLENYAVQPLSAAEIQEVVTSYGTNDAGDKRALAGELATHVSFQCGTYSSGQAYTNDFWLYRFNHRSACQFLLKPLMPGVYHTSELQYVWGAQAKLGCVFTPEESSLSHRMQGMWANFSKCLDPTCGGAAFPKYTNSSRKALVLETPSDSIEEDYQGSKCNLWDRLIYERYRGRKGGPSIFNGIMV
jgi:para-nitrobenzyl esterase